MRGKRRLPAQLRRVDLVDDLVIEKDDFLDHPDEVFDSEGIDVETELFFPLFPNGADDALAEEWKDLFEGDASLRALAPRTAAIYGASAGAYSGSGRDLGIANRLRAYGLKVVEISGWQTRGSSTFHPRGSIDHHTAGPFFGNAPSLKICTDGRSDLPGPLCQVLIGRDNTCYVIASGRANHAGTGTYAGVAGNSNVYGVEHENTGVGNEPWREDQRVTAAKVHAALLDWNRNGFVCEHKEWTSRKIDKWDQSGSDMRARTVKAWGAFDNKEPQDMPLFANHQQRQDFVTRSFQQVAGRTPPTADRDAWTYAIGVSEMNALELLSALAKESREAQDNAIGIVKNSAAAAATKATTADTRATAAAQQATALGVRVTELEQSPPGGVTLDQVMQALAAKIAV